MCVRLNDSAIFLTLALLGNVFCAAEAAGGEAVVPEITGVVVNDDAIPRYEKFEISFQVSGEWSNPFDPDEIAVDGIFETPDGRTMTMPGFYFQDYHRANVNGREVLTPVDNPMWKVRFSPTMPGAYHYKLRAVSRGQTVETEQQTFQCSDNSNKNGFLRVSTENPRYFMFDDETSFFVVGENIATLGSMGVTLADKWYTSLARAGGNFARMWWCAGGTDLESRVSNRPEQGLGRYKLDQAWRIDHIVDMADQLGIYVMACLETQQYLRRNAWWDRFTYNEANGGPVKSPTDYFVNDEADAYFKKRLRYIVARWSYSTAIFSWQFWNEVSACNDFNADNAARWHERMARYLRSTDPYDHIIHTNFGNLDGYEEIDGLPEMEVISTNIYSRRDMGETAAWGTEMMTGRYKKPYLLTEYGVGHRGHWVEDDPTGVIVHNGLWGALMSGSAGAALPWGWGHWIDKQNMYHYWKVVSDTVRDIPFHKRQWKPISVAKLVYRDSSKKPYYTSVFLEGWPRNYAYNIAPSPRPTDFRILSNGEVDKPESFRADFYSQDSQTLSVDFPEDGTLVIHVPEISDKGEPVLRVTVDGELIFDRTLTPHNADFPWQFWQSYPIPLTKGHHDIEISKDGEGAFWLGYELQNYLRREGPELDVMGTQTKDYILLWARNPNFIWIYDREGRRLGRQSEGLLTLNKVSNGEYSVVWRETTTGEVLARRVATAKGGRLTILTPRITRSAAARLTKLSQ
ncbi:DUF5060 domain-containing protein [Candidatus Poribacteria bacterium]